ncbi:MAG: choice-of-anchor D domain-containing protein, partial [Solirubrobacteraceae bacterium]
KSASVRVDSDAPTSPDTIGLSGNGIASAFLATPASKDFGSVQRGGLSATQTFTITNPGSAPLDVSTVTLGGTNAGEFNLVSDGCSGQALAPGTGSCQLVARFAPTSTTLGAKQASLAIASDAPSTPDHLALSGTSTPPPPLVTTGAATKILPTGATVNGTVDPQASPTTAHFDFGTTTAYGSRTPEVSVGSGGVVSVSAMLSKLKNKTTYHFRLVAHNAGGTTNGADATFFTPPPKSPHTLLLEASAAGASHLTFKPFTISSGGLLLLGHGPLAVDANGRAMLPLKCVEGCGRMAISLTVVDHGRTLTIAHRRLTLRANGHHRVALPLTARGRALLARTHALHVIVRVRTLDRY